MTRNNFNIFNLSGFISTLLITIGSVAFKISPASSQESECFQTFAEADLLFTQGNRTEAEQLYRQCKAPFDTSASQFPEEITDPSLLSPYGRVWWRQTQEGWNSEKRLESKVLAPLNLLLEKHPEFMPAHILMAETSEYYGNREDALVALEEAVSLFPYSAELAKLRVGMLEKEEQWLEASIAARQFAIINPDHEQSASFQQLADDYFGKFRGELKTELIVFGFLGAGVDLFTGGTSGIFKTAQMASLMIQGESEMGAQFAEAEKQSQIIIDDPELNEYVNTIGQDIAQLMGRDEFEYEFFIIQDETLNAFAYPGGKIFINSGALMNIDSEAELAGLIGHEISHAALSHGYQRVLKNNLLSSLGAKLPFGDFVANLVGLDYSRSNERQSDILATRALASYGYAADGLRDFFLKLETDSHGHSHTPEYLSTHPATDNRVEYLEELIDRNGYNRYAYQGVEKHAQMKARLQEILDASL